MYDFTLLLLSETPIMIICDSFISKRANIFCMDPAWLKSLTHVNHCNSLNGLKKMENYCTLIMNLHCMWLCKGVSLWIWCEIRWESLPTTALKCDISCFFLQQWFVGLFYLLFFPHSHALQTMMIYLEWANSVEATYTDERLTVYIAAYLHTYIQLHTHLYSSRH